MRSARSASWHRTPRDLTDEQRSALEALARQTVALLEQRRSQAMLQQEMRLAELLHATAAAANDAASTDKAVAACLELVCSQMGWRAGKAVRLDGDHPGKAALWYADDPESLSGFRRAIDAAGRPSAVDLLARIAETGKHAWFESLADDAAESAGLRTVVVMPVLIRREVVALFCFFVDEALAHDERVVDAMGTVGAQLGRALERDRAERALAHRFADLNAVLDATTEGICLSDLDGQVRYVNTAMEELWNALGLPTRGSVGRASSSSRGAPRSRKQWSKPSRRCSGAPSSVGRPSSSSTPAARSSPTAFRCSPTMISRRAVCSSSGRPRATARSNG